MAKPWKESRWGAYYDKAFGYSWYGETGYLDKIPEFSSTTPLETLHRPHIELIFKEDLWGSVRSTKDLERLLPDAISRAAGGDSELAQRLSLPENFYSEFVKICEEIRGKCNFETLAELGEVYRRFYYKETLAYKDSSGKYYLDKPAGIDTEPVESAVVGNVLDFDGRNFNNLMAVTGLQSGAYGTFLSPLPVNGNGSPLWSSNPNLPNSSTGGYGYGPQYALVWQFAAIEDGAYSQLVSRLSGISYKGTVLGPGGGVSQAFEDARLREAGKQEEIDKRLAQRTAEANRLEEGQKAEDLTEEEIRQAISFEHQRLLAQNVGQLADANIRRGYAKEKYRRSYMIDGDPYKLINLLTLRENGADFSKITVPQASALVPQISLFKVLYNDNGSYEGETRILFKTFLELQKQTSQATGVETTLGGARSGVGIKSFEWELNGTNIANVKSDITAKLVLYFQNFDDLLQANEEGFRYVDLLVRPSKEDLEDDSIDTKETAEFINVDTKELDPKFYEIKAEVGWASNDSYLGSPINKKAIQNAIKSQKHTFFLTLVDHEFEINQDGTFMLTINYRARLDGMLNDVRADVLMTEESKRKISELTDRLDDAKKKDPDREKRIKEEIKQVKDEQRHASNTDILNKLLTQDKIFVGYYDKDTIRSVGYDLGKLDAKTLNLTTDGLPTPANEDFLQRITEDAVSQANADAAKARGALVVDEDRCAVTNSSVSGVALTTGATLLTPGGVGGIIAGGIALYNDSEGTSNVAGQVLGGVVTGASTVGSAVVNFFGGSSPVEEESPDIQEIDSDEYSCFGIGYASQTGTEVVRKPKSLDDLEELGLYQSNGRYFIPYFFLGDLIDIVAQKALDVLAADEDSSPGIFSDPRTKNIKIILGSIGVQNLLSDVSPGRKIVNIGDIPVSVDMYRDFWARRVTKKERDSYSLNQFIKDCLEEFVLDAIGYQDFDGQRKQMFRVTDATISLPAKMAGGSPLDPLYDRIKETNGDKSTGLTIGVSADGGEARKLGVTDTLTFGSRINIDALKDPTPLLKVGEARFTAEDTFQYKVFYIQNVLSSNMRGNRREDESNGIMHLGLGEDRGLVKQASFSRTDLQGLREQRVVERDRLDPLSHLADVYNVNFTMFGNTLFWPGQYLFFNPIGFGSRFGSPLDPRSISRVMGLGGYHKVVKVSSFIEAAKFETTVEALYETSGGDKSELAHGPVEGTESNDSGNIQAAQVSQPIATQSNVGDINKKE